MDDGSGGALPVKYHIYLAQGEHCQAEHSRTEKEIHCTPE